MTTSPEYDAILARKMAESEAKRIRGNLSSKTMTPEEMATEISAIVPGYAPTIDANILHPKQIESLKSIDIERPTDYASEFLPMKKKRGWPKGVKRGPRKPKSSG